MNCIYSDFSGMIKCASLGVIPVLIILAVFLVFILIVNRKK